MISYGEAIENALHLIELGRRGTGRTSRMIAKVRSGDYIVVGSSRDRHSLQHYFCGLDVKFLVIDPSWYISDIWSEIQEKTRGNSQARVWADHTWYDSVYLNQLRRFTKEHEAAMKRMGFNHVD